MFRPVGLMSDKALDNLLTTRVPESKPLNLQMTWPVMHRDGFEYRKSSFQRQYTSWSDLSLFAALSYTPAPLLYERINTGYGLERNRLGVQITNNENQPVSAVWLEEWPHWIKLYMHTLQVSVNGQAVERGEPSSPS